MREIKFRGKKVDNGEWVEGFLFIGIPETYESYIFPSEIYNGYVHSYCDNSLLSFEKFKAVIPETVGQFTGLKDKNGVDIFEGDILTYDYSDCKEFKDWMINPCYIVKYEEENNYIVAGIGIKNNLYCHAFRFKQCQVIGNIYDNPELLK